jgi:uncharacterized membrane protein YgaE (UPF0421/DUF939 family)
MRGRQAIRVVAGVVLGIGIGAAVVSVGGHGPIEIIVASAVALAIGTAIGANPVTTVQAAASAILIVALHRPGQNLAVQRLVDALIGGGLAVLLARVLFPVDPIAMVRREFVRLREDIADVFDLVARALRGGERAPAQEALARVDGIDERRLREALTLAREVARVAPRRRPARRRLEALDDLATSLSAAVGDTRALVTGALRTLDTSESPPHEAADAVEALAGAFRTRDAPEVREWVSRARTAARTGVARDGSLGMSVLGHAISSIADDLEGSARARDAAQRAAENVRGPFRAWRPRERERVR